MPDHALIVCHSLCAAVYGSACAHRLPQRAILEWAPANLSGPLVYSWRGMYGEWLPLSQKCGRMYPGIKRHTTTNLSQNRISSNAPPPLPPCNSQCLCFQLLTPSALQSTNMPPVVNKTMPTPCIKFNHCKQPIDSAARSIVVRSAAADIIRHHRLSLQQGKRTAKEDTNTRQLLRDRLT
jgi:hypothetical protein